MCLRRSMQGVWRVYRIPGYNGEWTTHHLISDHAHKTSCTVVNVAQPGVAGPTRALAPEFLIGLHDIDKAWFEA